MNDNIIFFDDRDLINTSGKVPMTIEERLRSKARERERRRMIKNRKYCDVCLMDYSCKYYRYHQFTPMHRCNELAAKLLTSSKDNTDLWITSRNK